jgi:hypothetical protein
MESNSLQLQVKENPADIMQSSPDTSSFSMKGFEHAQRVAKMLSSSSLIPKEYQGNIQNTMIALEMANRIGASPLMVMQNLNIIQGKPSWSSSFIIASLNACKRFSPIRFVTDGKDDAYGCTAWAFDLATNDKLEGPKVTWEMVKAEGWLSKGGSKWKTMPELMFRYRAAAFFGRLYAPDILMGMQTAEELLDFQPTISQKIDPQELKELYEAKRELFTADEQIHIERIINTQEELSYPKLLKNLQSK